MKNAMMATMTPAMPATTVGSLAVATVRCKAKRNAMMPTRSKTMPASTTVWRLAAAMGSSGEVKRAATMAMGSTAMIV